MDQLSTYVQPWEPFVSEGGNQIAENGNGNKDEKDLIDLCGEDSNGSFLLSSRYALKDVDAGDKEQGGSKIDGESNCDISHHI